MVIIYSNDSTTMVIYMVIYGYICYICYIYPIPSFEAIWTQMDSLDEASAAERLVVLSAEAAAQDGKLMDWGR